MTTPNEGRGEDPGYGTQQAQGDEPRVVVRDRRRIDPQTGQVRPPATEEPLAGSSGNTEEPLAGSSGNAEEPLAASNADESIAANAGEQLADGEHGGGRHAAVREDDTAASAVADALQAQLNERTGDLQRLTAEYANYRKRVERDRESVVASAKAGLVGELLSVLDDVERAGVHGDLTGAFKTVADKLVAVLQRAGLEPFGQDGEPFDPSVHEAVQHDTSPDVSGPTVTAVLRRGYRFGDRVVRAALVGVTDHDPGASAQGAEPTASSEAAPADAEVTSESVGPHGTSAH